MTCHSVSELGAGLFEVPKNRNIAQTGQSDVQVTYFAPCVVFPRHAPSMGVEK